MHAETGADGLDPEGDRPATRDLSDASAATMCSGNGAAADIKVEEGEADVVPTLPLILETFEDMGLKAGLLRGILAAGLERPSPLQLAAAVPILGGTDTILLHRNCTGATTSLVIGMLQRVDPSVKFVQAIFVAASPELAMGAQGYFSSLGKYSSLKILALARSGSERDTTTRITRRCTHRCRHTWKRLGFDAKADHHSSTHPDGCVGWAGLDAPNWTQRAAAEYPHPRSSKRHTSLCSNYGDGTGG